MVIRLRIFLIIFILYSLIRFPYVDFMYIILNNCIQVITYNTLPQPKIHFYTIITLYTLYYFIIIDIFFIKLRSYFTLKNVFTNSESFIFYFFLLILFIFLLFLPILFYYLKIIDIDF